MLKVVARSPATSTLAVEPKTMPWGLTRKIRPFAERAPRIVEGSIPVTRLSATEDAPGWMNLTSSLALMLNWFQLMMALPVAWLMIIVLAAGVVMAAEPPATVPPWGSAWAILANRVVDRATVPSVLTAIFCPVANL